MASTKDFLDFVLEQLSSLCDITFRAMVGEYIIYYRGKIIGGVYDNRFLVKPTKSVLKILPDAQMEIPYPGAKPMVLIEDMDNQESLANLIIAMYPELPKVRK